MDTFRLRLGLFALLFLCTGFFSGASYSSPLDSLPSWPVTNIGEPIPEELLEYWSGKVKDSVRIGEKCRGISGHYRSFPAKAKVIYDSPWEPHPNDPRDDCGDGDQTMYNGLLCAAGIKDGCRGVAEAQDPSGRWFRSPHRV
jgi:hypothetical protein